MFDDLRAAPPSTYDLHYWTDEGAGSALIKVYSITSEGAIPQLQATLIGSGSTRIGTPGIEVRIVIEVTGADTFVTMQRYLNV